MLVVPVLGRQRQEDSRALLVSQSSLLDKFQANERPCLKTNRKKAQPPQQTDPRRTASEQQHWRLTPASTQAHVHTKADLTLLIFPRMRNLERNLFSPVL